MIQISEKKECCGCEGCYNVCPIKCISMEYDEEGFKFPSVDKKKCIKCNLCENVCPIINKSIKKVDYIEGYAALNTNDTSRLKSSSGGVFSLLAQEIIDLGGIVVGVSMSQDCKVAQHIIVDSKKDLELLLGSKYLQSNIGNRYQKIKNELNNKRTVLFSGTPCQVVALHRYLGKEYENLICIDLICHGVPSPGLWKKNVEYIENKTKAVLKSVNFRYKKEQMNLEHSILYPNVCYKSKDEDSFFRMFMKEYSLRLSCYDCKFKGISRISDITLGDFWGINDFCPGMDDGKGCSLVVIQSTKGKELFSRIKNYLKIKKVNIEKVFEKHNDAMIRSSKLPIAREVFWKDYQILNFEKLSKKYVSLTAKEKIRKFFRKVGLLEKIRKIRRGVVTSNSFGMLYVIKKVDEKNNNREDVTHN